MGVKISELVQADTRQGKDIHYSVGDDATEQDASAPPQEVKEEESETTASPPPTPQQPEPPAEPKEPAPAEQVQPAPSAAPVQAEKEETSEAEGTKTSEDVDLDLLLDIPLEIKVELGRSKIRIQKLMNLANGSAIKLVKLEGDPVDILVNDTLIARGEVVVQNEKYGIRVTEITSRMDRIRSFSI